MAFHDADYFYILLSEDKKNHPCLHILEYCFDIQLENAAPLQ